MKKKIYRLQSNKMIGGVCAGLADYLDIDATLDQAAICGGRAADSPVPMFLFLYYCLDHRTC